MTSADLDREVHVGIHRYTVGVTHDAIPAIRYSQAEGPSGI